MAEVFTVCDRKWRGIGNIPASGCCLKPEYASWMRRRLSTSASAMASSKRPRRDKSLARGYRRNAASRILGSDKKIIDIVNNYSKISFDQFPVLRDGEKHFTAETS
jgi:hypothetical protein